MKAPYKLYNIRKYWQFKYRFLRLNFEFKRKAFSTKELYKSEKYKIDSFFALIKLTIWSVIKAIIFIVIAYILENLISAIWIKNIALIPKWLISIHSLIPKPTYPDNLSSVIELVSVIASVTGVILALFYPILATIISTAYSKVHQSIRNLILREKVTQDYLRKLTFLTSFAITVLLGISFGFYPGNFILFFLAFYTLISLFNLLKLGNGVYTLLEPNKLLSLTFMDITETIDKATVYGIYSNDINFQNKYYKDANNILQSVDLITKLCLTDYLNESSLKDSITNSTFILGFYISKKKQIPLNSLWFPNIYNHLSYFESDMTLRDLAKSTNTYIQPKKIQNLRWFEEKVIANVTDSFQVIGNEGHIKLLGESIHQTFGLIDDLSIIGDVETAKDYLNKLLPIIQNLGTKKTIEQEVTTYEEWKHELACVETFCYLSMRFQLGLLDQITLFDNSKFNEEYSKINWLKETSFYKTMLPSGMYDRLKDYQEFISNEYLVEGKQITPDWYLKQALMAEYLKLVDTKLKGIVEILEFCVIDLCKYFNTENNALLASVAAHIGFETIHKLNFRIHKLKKVLENLNNFEVSKGEFTWTKTDYKGIQVSFKKLENLLLSIVIDNIEKLSAITWNKQFPDIFSHSYSHLLTAINTSILNNDLIQFQRIFSPLLKSTISAFNNLNKTFKHYTKPENISYQVLIDIMQISGHGYIYSKIYKNEEYWNVVTSAWDESFVATEENISIFISYYYYYKDTLNGTGINFNEKNIREETLKTVIEKLGITPKSIDDFLVQRLIPEDHYPSFYDPAELFIELYLFTFLSAKPSLKIFRRELFQRWANDLLRKGVTW